MTTIIQVRGVTKRYGSNKVLDQFDLDILEGETIVILGRSGVGKSVLLKHIIGLTKPDEGTIHVSGKEVTSINGKELYPALRHMGMLFQGSALFDSMNIEQNTAFFLTEHGKNMNGDRYSKEELDALVANALSMVGLEGIQKKMPSELSGGMRKRAALARLIVYRPSILLYDEPTTGLDPITAMQINELIVKTQKELGATSIVVTHDILSALYVGDRLALIRDGKIAYLEDPDTFMRIDDPMIDFLRKTISQDPRSFRAKLRDKL